MHLPDWSLESQRWDAWQAFHIPYNYMGLPLLRGNHWQSPVFVQFDTGELVCMLQQPGPEARRGYSMFGVRLAATGDADCPTLYMPDGEPAKPAWLKDGGQQYLLIDESSKRAVGLGRLPDSAAPSRFYSTSRTTVRTPQGLVQKEVLFSKIVAYFPGPGRMPVGVPITVAKPWDAELDKDERQHILSIERQARAAMTLLDEPIKYISGKCEPEKLLAVERWDELEYADRAKLFRNGLGRRRFSYSYLDIK